MQEQRCYVLGLTSPFCAQHYARIRICCLFQCFMARGLRASSPWESEMPQDYQAFSPQTSLHARKTFPFYQAVTWKRLSQTSATPVFKPCHETRFLPGCGRSTVITGKLGSYKIFRYHAFKSNYIPAVKHA